MANDAAVVPDLVEEITVHLSRVAPGEMEAAELVDEIGGDNDEIREALKWMDENGKLDPKADHFRLASSVPAPKDGAPPEEPPEEDPDQPSAELASPAAVPGGLPVSAEMKLVVQLTRRKGDDDDAVGKKVEALWRSLGQAIEAQHPTLDVVLDVVKIETFDQARVIFQIGGGDGPDDE